ncbi:MAG: aldo/keto reductase [Burkholderiaceae bacterium]
MSKKYNLFPHTVDGLALGLGGATLGNLFTRLSDDDARFLLKATLQSGCRSFDTAPHYGNGLSEQRMGQVLRTVSPDSFVLSSKVGRLLLPMAGAPRDQNGYLDVLPFVQSWDYSVAGVRRSVHDSLQRMGMARLDVAYIHDCDATTHASAYPRVLRQVVEEALPELRRMQSEGLVGQVGLGVNDVQVCLDVLERTDLDCLLLAGRYSLLDQSAQAALLPLCLKRGVRIALGGVFNSGILATGVRTGGPLRFNYAPAAQQWVERVAAIEVVCERHGVPLRAAALQFPLAHPAINIVMLGAQTIDQWQDGLAMMRFSIAPAFWADLRQAGLLGPGVPTP